MKLGLSSINFQDTQLILKMWICYAKLLSPYDLRVFKTCEDNALTSLRTHNQEFIPPVCILECRLNKLGIYI
jgi:hypothetical protein